MGCVETGARGGVEETWFHGVCGGDLVPWCVWRRPGVPLPDIVIRGEAHYI